MRALVYYGPGNVHVEDIARPEVDDSEVLIKTSVCAVCATDVKTALQGHKYIKPPAVLGHEISGEVVKKGRNVRSLDVGDRVAVGPYAPCGACHYCRLGKEILCERLFEEGLVPGGFAEYVKVPKRLVEKVTVKLENGVSFEEGALLEPLACVIKSVQNVSVSPEQSALIVGAGPMGLMHVMVLKGVYGLSTVAVTDLIEERLALAKSFGADHVVNVSREDVSQRARELTDGRGFDVVFVDTPSPEAVAQAFSCVRRGGIVCLFAGLPPGKEEQKVNLNRIHYDEVAVCGSFGFAPRHYHLAYSLVRSKRVNLARLISHKVRLEEVPAILKDIAQHRTLKVAVVF
jgi:L-iditol 2-dehydrogenase